MIRILCIETSTEVCSVSIVEDGVAVAIKEDIDGRNHSKLLTKYIDDLLKGSNLTAASFSAVAVSEGPGSYTGLRIGVSAAKGFCFATDIPLIAVSPLESMTHCVLNQFSFESKEGFFPLFLPMIDARRMEVYAALYDGELKNIVPVEARVIDENSYSAYAGNSEIYYFGNGAAKCVEILPGSVFKYYEGIITSSRYMAGIAHRKYTEKQFVDVAYFEPFYLKDFIATTPRNSVLGNV
jgi:tRNA threonylcarbamoyladenosine biosynthesis protein TsaB